MEKFTRGLAFFGLLLGIPTGGLGLYIVFPTGLLAIVLKIFVDLYDSVQDARAKVQLNFSYENNWELLKGKIVSLCDDQYVKKIEIVLSELDLSQKPPKEGSSEIWNYLNQKLETAVTVYLTILRFIQDNNLGPRKEKLEAFSVLGLTKVRDFRYIFQIFERSKDIWIRGTLADVLALITYTAPTDLLLIFLEYVNKDYRHLRPSLVKSIINRAQDFTRDEIQKIMKEINGDDKRSFYLLRTRYFFEKAYNYSNEVFNKDADSWLNKIIEDFGITGSRIYVELLNPESSLLLALACQKLGNINKAIFVLEWVLSINPSFLPAINLFVTLNETRGEHEKVANLLVRSRKHIVTDEWGQAKLNEYGLL